MQCKNSKIQNAINNIFLSCCILTWIECLIFSFVFVVVGMYNLGQLFLITWFTDLIFEKMGQSVEIKIKIKFHYTHYFNFV